MIAFTIYGKPQPKQRPRVLRSGITYTPKETVLYEAQVVQAAKESETLPQSPIQDKPLKMILWCYYPIPQSWTKEKKTLAARGKVYHTSRPDIDNLAKIIMDALNGIAYKDDALIAELVIHKLYSDEPRAEVVIDYIN